MTRWSSCVNLSLLHLRVNKAFPLADYLSNSIENILRLSSTKLKIVTLL
jgi:hypothetical protein